jgi:hypothetical protein
MEHVSPDDLSKILRTKKGTTFELERDLVWLIHILADGYVLDGLSRTVDYMQTLARESNVAHNKQSRRTE